LRQRHIRRRPHRVVQMHLGEVSNPCKSALAYIEAMPSTYP
jgi:hypothetical protein